MERRWSNLGFILGLLWVYEGGFGSLLGYFEIALGVGLLIPAARTISARCLIVLVLIMSLANLNMYLNDIPFNGTLLSTTGHLIRLIIQAILLLVLLWLGVIF